MLASSLKPYSEDELLPFEELGFFVPVKPVVVAVTVPDDRKTFAHLRSFFQPSTSTDFTYFALRRTAGFAWSDEICFFHPQSARDAFASFEERLIEKNATWSLVGGIAAHRFLSAEMHLLLSDASSPLSWPPLLRGARRRFDLRVSELTSSLAKHLEDQVLLNKSLAGVKA